jgi:phospholipid/cholesterol/gamma-HCH transport system ATP-binding protein
MRVERGRVVAIMGGSGSGKTTLLRLIGGQLRPNAGSIRVAGESVPDLGREDLYRLRRRMSMLFQFGALFTDLTVFENVAFPLREHTRLPESMIRDLVVMKLEAVGLRGAHRLMPAELSGGMARRAALARAVVLDPMLVMYDEPFAGLDPIALSVVGQLIRKLNDALGVTSIVCRTTSTSACRSSTTSTSSPRAASWPRGRLTRSAAPPTPSCASSCTARPTARWPFHYAARPYPVDVGLEPRSANA